MNPKLLARAGLATAPVTAFAPAAGAALTGYGSPWLAVPAASLVAAVIGIRAERRAAATRRHGFVVADPAPDADGIVCATAPRDLITVAYHWHDEAA